MKKLASILLLGILLFNWVGYRLVSHYLEQKANSNLEALIDKNDYDESQLIEIRVPINIPYQTDWKEFERYDGEVEIDGIHYKYVKRKIQDGALVLLCLPNKAKMNLQTAREDFFKLVNDLQQTSSKSKPSNSSSIKNFTTEYWKEDNNWKIAPCSIDHQKYQTTDLSLYRSFFLSTPWQPPDVNG